MDLEDKALLSAWEAHRILLPFIMSTFAMSSNHNLMIWCHDMIWRVYKKILNHQSFKFDFDFDKFLGWLGEVWDGLGWFEDF